FAFNHLGLFWATLFIGLNRVWVAPILIAGAGRHIPVNWPRELLELSAVVALAVAWAFHKSSGG
ncbi:MAG: hypothetical protein AAGF90_11295, partial [Pseudomonadota bacterium]